MKYNIKYEYKKFVGEIISELSNAEDICVKIDNEQVSNTDMKKILRLMRLIGRLRFEYFKLLHESDRWIDAYVLNKPSFTDLLKSERCTLLSRVEEYFTQLHAKIARKKARAAMARAKGKGDKN